MWFGLKCKTTIDGLEGRPLICTENRGTTKIPQAIKQNILCHLKNWQQLCTYTTSVNFPCCWWQPSFNFSSKKKNKQTNNTNATGGLMSFVSRGPSNQALYFLKYFHPQATPKCSCGVVLDVGLCYFKVPVKSKLSHPPWAFELLGYWSSG